MKLPLQTTKNGSFIFRMVHTLRNFLTARIRHPDANLACIACSDAEPVVNGIT